MYLGNERKGAWKLGVWAVNPAQVLGLDAFRKNVEGRLTASASARRKILESVRSKRNAGSNPNGIRLSSPPFSTRSEDDWNTLISPGRIGLQPVIPGPPYAVQPSSRQTLRGKSRWPIFNALGVRVTRGVPRSLWPSNVVCMTALPRIFELTNRAISPFPPVGNDAGLHGVNKHSRDRV